MKKVITAMGNDVLNIELKKYAKYDVLYEDLICQDYVINKLPNSNAEVLIISGLLQGRWNLEEFIQKIRKDNNKIRIIIVIDEIDVTTRRILNDMNVLDIFLDSSVEVRDIIEAIDREETIKKKYEMLCEVQEEYKLDENKKINENISKENFEVNNESNIIIEKAVQKQEIITIAGIPGSRKIYYCNEFLQNAFTKE